MYIYKKDEERIYLEVILQLIRLFSEQEKFDQDHKLMLTRSGMLYINNIYGKSSSKEEMKCLKPIRTVELRVGKKSEYTRRFGI